MFYSFELAIDNKELDVSYEEFRDEYHNLDDMNLGQDAPADRFIATSLGQNTLVFSDESDTIETSYDAELHSGTWTFSTNACVYVFQAQDLISTLECSRGVNKIEINFIDCTSEIG